MCWLIYVLNKNTRRRQKKKRKKITEEESRKNKKNYLRKNWRKNPYSFDWFLLLYSFKEERLFENTFWHHMKFELNKDSLKLFQVNCTEIFAHLSLDTQIYKTTILYINLFFFFSFFLFFCFLKGKKKIIA